MEELYYRPVAQKIIKNTMKSRYTVIDEAGRVQLIEPITRQVPNASELIGIPHSGRQRTEQDQSGGLGQ